MSKVSLRLIFVSRLALTCLLAAVVWHLAGDNGQAAKKATDARAADQLVGEALQREIYGQNDQRRDLLKQALAHRPDCQPALWHSGYVKINNQWTYVDDVARQSQADLRLLRYEKKRSAAPPTAAGQLTLADWCAKNRLPDRERAHLTRVLKFEPEHAAARRRLGFVRIGENWLSTGEITITNRRAAEAAVALGQWQPKLEHWRHQIIAGNPKQREFAKDRVREIHDAAAIPALETVLSAHSEPLALLAVDTLSGITGSEASVSIARHAVLSTHSAVRDQATRRLRQRPMDDYVPVMLAAMRLPIQAQRELVEGPRGRLLYRHTLTTENQDARRVAVWETEYRRIGLPGGDRRQTLDTALDRIRERAEDRDQIVAASNQRRTELNSRLVRVLQAATQQTSIDTPESWWSWWNTHNEVYIAGDKPTRRSVERDQVSLVDRSSLAIGGSLLNSGPAGVIGISGSLDCLAAGTLVWTDLGPRPVQSIDVGDRVLSQDPQSGELAYKPVLGRTVRPPSALVNIQIGDEEIQSSGGHLFWASGDGWVRARDVKGGAVLHGIAGSVTVSVVKRGPKARTYNLIVADYATYFVGKSKILSHDNTVRRRTKNIVPGLAAD